MQYGLVNVCFGPDQVDDRDRPRLPHPAFGLTDPIGQKRSSLKKDHFKRRLRFFRHQCLDLAGMDACTSVSAFRGRGSISHSDTWTARLRHSSFGTQISTATRRSLVRIGKQKSLHLVCVPLPNYRNGEYGLRSHPGG